MSILKGIRAFLGLSETLAAYTVKQDSDVASVKAEIESLRAEVSALASARDEQKAQLEALRFNLTKAQIEYQAQAKSTERELEHLRAMNEYLTLVKRDAPGVRATRPVRSAALEN